MQDLTPAVTNGPIVPSAALPAGQLAVAAVSNQRVDGVQAAADPLALELEALRQQALSTEAGIKQLQLEGVGDSDGRSESSLPSSLDLAAILPTIGVLVLLGLIVWMFFRRGPARPVGASGFSGHSDHRREAGRPGGADHGSRVTYRPAPSKWLWKSLDHSPRVVYRDPQPAEVESQRAWLGEPIPAAIPRSSVSAEEAPLSQWLPPDSEWSSSQFVALQRTKAAPAPKAIAPSARAGLPPEALARDELPIHSGESDDFEPSGNSLMYHDAVAVEAVEHVRKSLANRRVARANAWGMESGENDSEAPPDSGSDQTAAPEAPRQAAVMGGAVAASAAAAQDAAQSAAASIIVSATSPEPTPAVALAVPADGGEVVDDQSALNTLEPDELPSTTPEPPEPEPLYGGNVKLALAQEFAALGLHAAARELANEVLAGAPDTVPAQAQELLHQIEQKEQAQALEHKRLGVPDKDRVDSESKSIGSATGIGNLPK